MASPKRAFESVIRSQGTVAFRDLERLLIKLGFRLARTAGSHHIYVYVHPRVGRPVNIQAAGKDAKPYQVRQIRDIIEEFKLTLDD